jgi:hypothetical protein
MVFGLSAKPTIGSLLPQGNGNPRQKIHGVKAKRRGEQCGWKAGGGGAVLTRHGSMGLVLARCFAVSSTWRFTPPDRLP